MKVTYNKRMQTDVAWGCVRMRIRDAVQSMANRLIVETLNLSHLSGCELLCITKPCSGISRCRICSAEGKCWARKEETI